MADTIDKLQIEIDATSSDAAKKINALADAVEKLKAASTGNFGGLKSALDAVARVDAGAITQISDALKALKDASSFRISKGLTDSISALSGAMKAVKAEDVSRLGQVGRALQSFSSVGNIKINSRFADNLVLLSAAVNEIGEDAKNKLTGMAEALAKFSGIGGIRIPKDLGDNLRNIAEAVAQVPEDAIKRLDGLTTSLSKLSGVNLTGVRDALRGVQESTKEKLEPLDSEMKVNVVTTGTGYLDKLKEQLKEVGMEALLAKPKVELLQMELSALKDKLQGALNGTGKLLSEEQIASLILRIQSLQSEIKSLESSSGGVFTKLKAGFMSVISALGRIAFYRAVRSAIKAVTDALKEGLENAYEYSRLTGGELAQSLDRIATASSQMKNQMGAAFGQLIQLLEPVIVQLIHFVTKLAQVFTWLFAVISGSDTYLVANEVATSWKEADKAAKGYQRTLLGIDEINKLNGQNGGIGKSTPDYKSMFHEEPVNFKLKMPDISGWAKPILDWLDKLIDGFQTLFKLVSDFEFPSFKPEVELETEQAIAKVYGLADAIDWMVSKSPYLITIAATVPALASANELVRVLQEYLARSPYLVTMDALVPATALAAIAAFGAAIASVMAKSPYIVTLAAEVFSPVPEIQAITQQLQSEWAVQKQAVTDLVNGWITDYEKARVEIAEKHRQWDENANQTIASVWAGLQGFLEKGRGWLQQYDAAKARIMQDNAEIDRSIDAAISNAYSNVTAWVNNAGNALAQFGRNAAQSIGTAFTGIAQMVYSGLQSAGSNIVAFANGAGSAIHSWATNSLKSFVDWANGIIRSVADALTTAWQNFKNFMTARGEQISGAFSANKSWVIPVTITAAAVVGAIALAPYTGGASLAFVGAFANGGYPNTGDLFIANERGPEWVGSLNGRSTVANNGQVESGIEAAAYRGFMRALMESGGTGGTNGDDRAVNIYLDGRQIATTTTRYQRQYARATGG